MTPQTIHRVDYWIGRPLCLALTILRRAWHLVRPARVPSDPPRKILFVKLIEQGATVLAYRAIEHACEQVGRKNVHFLVFERNRAILDLLDLIPPANIHIIRDDGLVRFAFDTVRALRAIRRCRIDAAVDMEFFARASALLTFFTGSSRRVGLHRFTTEGPYRGDLMTHRVQSNPYLHIAPAYYMQVDTLTADPRQTPLSKWAPPPIDWVPPPFQPAPAETEEVRSLLTELFGRPPAGPIVLLNPNAGDLLPLRRWPTERFVELGRHLLADDPTMTIVVTGAPSEREAANAVAREIDPARAVCVAGRTTLRQLIVLYTIAGVLVTNDSGPGHFAALTSIHSVVLFGPETPAVFGPIGRNARALTAGLACSPCVNAMNHRFSPCDDNVCMREISVATVLSAVRDAIGRPAQARLALSLFQVDPRPLVRALPRPAAAQA